MSLRVVSSLLLATTLLGCGGPTVPDPYGQPRVPPVLSSLPTQTFTVPKGGAIHLDFDAPTPYIWTTLDWTAASNNVVAVFTSRGCHDVNDALAGRCYGGADTEVMASASLCAAKPRTLGASMSRPTAVRLWIANVGATDEAGTVVLRTCADPPNCGATLSCAQCIIAIATSCH